MECEIVRVWPQDTALLSQVDALLAQEGLSRDRNLDYTCALSVRKGRRKLQASAGTQQRNKGSEK